jgi:hypothetical protein
MCGRCRSATEAMQGAGYGKLTDGPQSLHQREGDPLCFLVIVHGIWAIPDSWERKRLACIRVGRWYNRNRICTYQPGVLHVLDPDRS